MQIKIPVESVWDAENLWYKIFKWKGKYFEKTGVTDRSGGLEWRCEKTDIGVGATIGYNPWLFDMGYFWVEIKEASKRPFPGLVSILEEASIDSIPEVRKGHIWYDIVCPTLEVDENTKPRSLFVNQNLPGQLKSKYIAPIHRGILGKFCKERLGNEEVWTFQKLHFPIPATLYEYLEECYGITLVKKGEYMKKPEEVMPLLCAMYFMPSGLGSIISEVSQREIERMIKSEGVVQARPEDYESLFSDVSKYPDLWYDQSLYGKITPSSLHLCRVRPHNSGKGAATLDFCDIYQNDHRIPENIDPPVESQSQILTT